MIKPSCKLFGLDLNKIMDGSIIQEKNKRVCRFDGCTQKLSDGNNNNFCFAHQRKISNSYQLTIKYLYKRKFNRIDRDEVQVNK